MNLKRFSTRYVAYAALGFSCMQMTCAMSHGFQVKMENLSGKNLKVSCRTGGQAHPVKGTTGRGNTVTCRNGAPSLKVWNHAPDKNSSLYFTGFNTHKPFYDRLTVTFLHEDNSLYCSLRIHYTTLSSLNTWFNVENNIHRLHPCTTDYLQGRLNLREAHIRIH